MKTDKNRSRPIQADSPGWQQAARVFDQRAVEYNEWFKGSLIYEIELAALQDLHIKTRGRKLEIGVGPGRFAEALDIALGVDPAWSPLQLAKQRGINPCQAIGENLPVLDNSLGAIYLLFTLCFASNPLQMLTECYRALSAEGCLVLGMVPLAGKWGQELSAKKKAGHDFYSHARFFTIDTAKQWFNETGFHIVEARSTLYQPPGFVKKMEKPQQDLDEQAGFVAMILEKVHE